MPKLRIQTAGLTHTVGFVLPVKAVARARIAIVAAVATASEGTRP
jgi:hypothetical protein